MLPSVPEEQIKETIAFVGLDDRIHDKVKTYSLGMRQRLGIAQALAQSPEGFDFRRANKRSRSRWNSGDAGIHP